MWISWAIIRVVPRPERGEAINAGIVLFARERGLLLGQVALDPARLRALAPAADAAAVERHLRALAAICAGTPEGGPLADLPAADRFHWLTAPRSTVIQPSAAHPGHTDDPRALLDDLMRRYVLPPDEYRVSSDAAHQTQWHDSILDSRPLYPGRRADKDALP